LISSRLTVSLRRSASYPSATASGRLSRPRRAGAINW
jgi:hypothetical protein